jgi:hypothetical protein
MNNTPKLLQGADLSKGIDTFVTRTRNVSDSSKQVLRALLAGVCVASFLAILSQSHLDQALTIAVGALAVALPTFVFCFFAGAREAIDPKEMSLGIVAVQTLSFLATWLDLLGFLAIMVGIGAIIFHLSSAAGGIFLITIGILVAFLFISGSVYIFFHLKHFIEN